MKRKRMMGLEMVEGVYFLRNWSLFLEAREGCERRIRKSGRKYQRFLKIFHVCKAGRE
jgi:hypothetical protein